MNKDNKTQILHHLGQDSVLKTLIESLDFPEIDRTNNIFHDLMSCLIEQQIHYRSTKKIFEKVLNQAKVEEVTLDNFYKLEESNFGGVKLSISKYKRIQSVILFFSQNDIDWNKLSNERIHELLGSIKGIGPKTIDMILLYSLGREDIFISDDYHIKQIAPTLYSLNSEAKLTTQISEIASRWSPYKSYSFLYLLEFKRKK